MFNLFFCSDHRGFELKTKLIQKYKSIYKIHDFGCDSHVSCNYNEISKRQSEYMKNDFITPESTVKSFGIFICGSGNGMVMCVNKFRYIRATLGHDANQVKMSRLHNNANGLCIGADYTDFETACQFIDVLLKTDFEGGRHIQRLQLD